MLSISEWLTKIGQEKYVEAFEAAEIDLRAAKLLSDDDLRELGLPLGPRKIVAAEIEKLSNTDAEVEDPPIAADARASVERRLISVLFCDLVGSTALSARVDPEEMRAVLEAYQRTVSQAVSFFGGHVANFLGDGVVAYFGWPVASEDQALQAVRAGLAAVAEVPLIKVSGLGEAVLSARVGIASGTVVVGDIEGDFGAQRNAIAGETPNLAARIESIAQPGSVAIGDTTAALVAPRFDLEDLGSHFLKGFDDPQQVWQVAREKPSRSILFSGGTDERKIVGRQNEIGILLEAWGEAQSGHGSTILVGGEAGVGKSRVLREFAVKLGDTRVIAFQCSANHTNTPLHPVADGIADFLGFGSGCPEPTDVTTASNPFVQLNGNDAKALASLLGWSPGNDHTEMINATEQRVATLVAIAEIIFGIAQKSPAVLIIEDAHWIDPTSLELLNRIVLRASQIPLLVIVSHRPEWTAPFAGHAMVAAITLRRLSPTQITNMVREIAGSHLQQEWVDRIAKRADGVPLFIEELTKSVIETGFANEKEIPASLQASLMARLDRLPAAKFIAQAASVVGRQFEIDLLCQICDRTEAEVNTAINQLLQAELLYQQSVEGRQVLTFKHALVQDIAYSSLLRQDRRKLHGAVSASLLSVKTEGAADLEVIAYHLDGAGEMDRAASLWREAADAAMQRSAQAEAVTLYRNALDADARTTEGANELDLLLCLGQAQFGSIGGAHPETRSTYGRACELSLTDGSSLDTAVALYGRFIGEAIGGETRASLETGDQMLELAKRNKGERWVHVAGQRLRTAPLYLMGRLQEGLASITEVIEFPETDVPNAFAHFAHHPLLTAHGTMAHIEAMTGRPDTALARAREGVNRSVEFQVSPNSTSYSLVWEMLVASTLKDRAALRVCVDQLFDHTNRTGAKFWQQMAIIGEGYCQMLDGAAQPGAEKISMGVNGFLATGALQQAPHFLLCLVEAQFESGDHEEASETLDQVQKMILQSEQTLYYPEVLRWRASLLTANGQSEQALALLAQSVQLAEDQGNVLWKLRALTTRVSIEQGPSRIQGDAQSTLQSFVQGLNEGMDSFDILSARSTMVRR